MKNSFSEKHSELWKFIKFSAVGLISTAIELIVFYLLEFLVFDEILTSPLPQSRILTFLALTQGKGYLYSYIISTTVGYSLAFIGNRKTTFKSDSSVLISTLLYVLMVIVTIFLTAYIGAKLQLYFLSIGYQSLGNIIVKPMTAILATIWTYPINRFVIHRKKVYMDSLS